MLSASDTHDVVRRFLSRHLRNWTPRDDEDFLASGRVTSLFAMELVLFVEREFGVTIENEDLDLDNFRTIDGIAGLVARKREAGLRCATT